MDKKKEAKREVKYSPIALESEAPEMGVRVGPESQNVAQTESLIREALDWLTSHRQDDINIRKRTAGYLLNYQKASQVEVAAALLSDLPPEVDFSGINPKTIQQAQRNSRVYSTEEIKKERSDRSVLIYRIWRSIAECSESIDRAEFTALYDAPRPERQKKIDRWKNVARLLSKKSDPELRVRAYDLQTRIDWLIKKFRYIPESPLGYEIKSSPAGIKRFCSHYVSAFLFNELRVDAKTLWISHSFFPNTQLIRLMDWVSRNADMKITLLSRRKTSKIPERQFSSDEYTWLEAADRVLGNACIVNPAKLLFENRKIQNLNMEINRLQKLAFGGPIEHKHIDPDKEEERLQKRIRRYLPKDAVSSLEWKKLHPGRALYVLTFNFICPEKELFPLDTESIPGRRFILNWIAENVPGIILKPVYIEDCDEEYGCSIRSPYRGEMLLEGSQEEIDKFDQAWSDSEGRSLDPRWQLVFYPCVKNESGLNKS